MMYGYGILNLIRCVRFTLHKLQTLRRIPSMLCNITTYFIAMCTPYLFNGVRRSTQAWLHNLALFSTIFIQYDNLPSSKDNR